MRDARIEQALELIQKALDDAYARGKQDAVNEILKVAGGLGVASQPISTTDSDDTVVAGLEVEDARKRAPRGSAERVIRRAIKAMAGSGADVQDIMAARQGDLEMMLVESSIRGELRRGEKQGKYTERDGRWHEEEEV